jgi:CubicO group peptidase (beta-lactamase class C family)
MLTAVCLATSLFLGQTDAPPGWELSKETYDRDRIQELTRKIADRTFQQIRAVIVVKSGKLLVEGYFNGAERDELHNPRSATKTIASALTGIAIAEGHLDGVEQTLGDFYELDQVEHPSREKAAVTIEQLLTMTSGFDGFDFEASSVGNEENMYPQPNWVKWILNLPMSSKFKPGETWHYFTAGVVLLGDILDKSVPGGLEKYAQEKLFGPLGITKLGWGYTPQGVPNTAGGLGLRALDLARFGQLYANHGKWGDRQVIPRAWVDHSLLGLHSTGPEGDRYGYLWWQKEYAVDGARYPVSYCSGNGGNKVFVFTDQPLVVVVTASAYNQGYMHTQVDEMMKRYVIPAVLKR